jgi:dTDP-4-amino-4,6-dideoxygalactose transaminase
VYHQFPIFCEKRDDLQSYLASKDIETLIHYPIPPHMQECYISSSQLPVSQLSAPTCWLARARTLNSQLISPLGGVRGGLPITERIANEELSIPMNQIITAEEAKEIVEAVNSYKKGE